MFKEAYWTQTHYLALSRLKGQNCYYDNDFVTAEKRGPGNETLKKRKEQTAFYNFEVLTFDLYVLKVSLIGGNSGL